MVITYFRGLHLLLLFFEKIVETHKTEQPPDDLAIFLREAYKETLEPYHGWMLQQLFNVIIFIYYYIYILHNYIIIHLYYILCYILQYVCYNLLKIISLCLNTDFVADFSTYDTFSFAVSISISRWRSGKRRNYFEKHGGVLNKSKKKCDSFKGILQ